MKNSKIVVALGWVTFALLASVIIWQLALFVAALIEANPIASRMVFGLIVSALSLLLLVTLYRREKGKFKLGISQVKKFLIGMLWYLVPALVGILVASLFGVIEVSLNGSFANAVGAVLLVSLLVFLSEALPEEIIFRGYIVHKLKIFSNNWVIIFVQAAIFTCFALMIGALGSVLDASFIFTFGIALGILRVASGSAAASIGFHLACMTAQQSFSSQWSPFVVSDGSMLQTFILGILPISVVIAYWVTKVPRRSGKSNS